jgi:hypothetical protein
MGRVSLYLLLFIVVYCYLLSFLIFFTRERRWTTYIRYWRPCYLESMIDAEKVAGLLSISMVIMFLLVALAVFASVTALLCCLLIGWNPFPKHLLYLDLYHSWYLTCGQGSNRYWDAPPHII